MNVPSISNKITAQQKADLFDPILNLSSEGIFIEDLQGNILACNEAGSRMFGFPREQMTGKNIREFLPYEEVEKLTRILREQAEFSQYREKFNRHRDGSLISVEVKVQYISLADERYRVAFIRDIGEKKELETERMRTMKSLLERNRTKKLIISTISHDLYNHFGNIKTMVDMFDSAEEYGGTDTIKSLIPSLKTSVNKSFDLLDSLFQWAYQHINQPSFTPEMNSLINIVEDAITLYADAAHQKNVRIMNHLERDLEGWFDSQMIASVIRNLVSNALKFTPPGGLISIRAESEDDVITCCIGDSGIGMTDEQLKSLFDLKARCYKIGEKDKTMHGFSLLLCKEFIEQNKGRIQLKSEVGKGTCCSFTLPAQPVPSHFEVE